MENSNEKKLMHSGMSGRVFAGIVLLIVGGVLFAHRLGYDLPYWLFRWEMLLIVLGVFAGAKNSFRNSGWLIPVAIGVFFLLDDWLVDINIKNFFWPTLIILAGLIMVLSPFKKKNWQNKFNGTNNTDEDYLESTCILGGVKKNVISKNFKGGNLLNIFGGVEIDLSQSDINGTVVLDITQIFGGTKLIIPSHWEIKTEITTILGGVEDKRKNLSSLNIAEGKTIVIKGTSILAGIDIKSF
jgi:predicted membrane protein